MIIRGASWCDLVKHADGRVELVSLLGSTVSCMTRWAIDAGQSLLYLRAAADESGRVCALGQGQQDGQAWATIEGGAPFSLGPTACPFPVLIFGDSLGWVVYIQRTTGDHDRDVPASVDVIRITAQGDHALIAATTVPPTSQGFLYVASTGQPITQDQGRGAIPGLALPSPAPSDTTVWAGQSTSTATIALFDSITGEITPLGTPGGQPPHIVESGGTYYVCSWVNGGAWLSTHQRPFPAPPPPDPIEDTSGDVIDLWPYVIPTATAFPRTSTIEGHGHEMHCVFDGRNLWTLPFGEPDHWVRMVVEGDTLTFREDRSRDGQSTGDYSFTRGLWARRHMRPGDRIENADNNLVRYEPESCGVVDVHAFPYRTGLWKRWTAFDCGGDLGTQDVIAYLYDPGGLADTYELSYFAKGFGFFRWEEYDQRTHTLRHWTTFNQFGGRAPQPTPGCWTSAHLDLTPEGDAMNAPGVTVDHYDPVIRPGQPWKVDFHDRNNDMTARVELVNGSVHVMIRNSKGEDRSGSPRPVDVRCEGTTEPPPIDPPVTPPVTPPAGGLDRIDGQLQIESGGGFVVNGRPVLPILCHFGDALSRWSRGQQTAVLQDLDDIAAMGYHGIRFWSTLGLDDHGGGYWAGRQVGPTYTASYWDHVQAFLQALRDRGLVCQFSLGDTRPVAVPDLRDYAYRAADRINAVGAPVVALGLEVNEDRDTGNQGAAKLAEFNQWFRERCPHVLVGLSAYTGTEDVAILNDYSRAPANAFVCHGYRGGHWWDKVRHAFSLVYEGKPQKRNGWQGEPPGPGSRVSAIDNKHEMDADVMCALTAMHLMTRQASVYFSGPGVISDEGERLQDMPGFREVPQVRALIPADVMRYDELFHGGETWKAKRVFAAQGDVRADHAYYRDGRFVCLVYGPGSLDVPQTRAAEISVDHRFGNKARLIVGRAT